MRELALFAGAGGGILGGKLLGWRTICAVEKDEYAGSVLIKRQNEGHLEPFPVWCDVRTFDGRPWRGRVDVVSGGFPCQDVSVAGKGAGIEGQRSGLWVEMARIIGEVLPRFAFVENSPALTSRGLGVVLGDLAQMGYHARWGVLGAHHAGAPHKRDRIWIVAEHPNAHSGVCDRGSGFAGRRKEERTSFGRVGEEVSNSNSERRRQESIRVPWGQDPPQLGNDGHEESLARSGSGLIKSALWKTEPCVGRVADGVADRVERLRCLGNGQVPAVAARAWEILSQ